MAAAPQHSHQNETSGDLCFGAWSPAKEQQKEPRSPEQVHIFPFHTSQFPFPFRMGSVQPECLEWAAQKLPVGGSVGKKRFLQPKVSPPFHTYLIHNGIQIWLHGAVQSLRTSLLLWRTSQEGKNCGNSHPEPQLRSKNSRFCLGPGWAPLERVLQ